MKFKSTIIMAALISSGMSLAHAESDAVSTRSIDALKNMGSYLQSLDQFQVTGYQIGEIVLRDGQKIQHSASAKLSADRPTKIKIEIDSPSGQSEIYYNGQTVALHNLDNHYYSTKEMPGDLKLLVTTITQKYGIPFPMADLFMWGTEAAPFDKLESGMFIKHEKINGKLAGQYAFRQGKVDWQIWIAEGKQPLPLKVVITNRTDEERPQSSSVYNWNVNAKFKDATFEFKPGKNATKAELVPLKK